MARDFGGDLYDFENMSDDEIRDVVVEHLRNQPNLDVDDIDVAVKDGSVTLAGRVGTDVEVQVAEAVLDDVLGLERYSNELVVDELARGVAPGAADDESSMLDEMVEDGVVGGGEYQSDTAEHLIEDLESETRGTEDMGRAIRDGTSYSPPDYPVGDGYGSREDH